MKFISIQKYFSFSKYILDYSLFLIPYSLLFCFHRLMEKPPGYELGIVGSNPTGSAYGMLVLNILFEIFICNYNSIIYENASVAQTVRALV